MTVRFYAGAAAAAGCQEELVTAATLGDVIIALTNAHGSNVARVLEVASFLVDGVVQRDHGAALAAASTVDVLPPFAGG